MRGIFVGLLVGTFAATAKAAPKVGDTLPDAKLQGDDGGLVRDGSEWSSTMTAGKVWAVFYVDPDFRDANEGLTEEMKKQAFPRDRYGSLAITNMDASALPNFIISSALRNKQEQYPDAVYVKDMKKKLVSHWGFDDDAYNVVLLDKKGKVLFSKTGEFSGDEIQTFIQTIKSHLDD